MKKNICVLLAAVCAAVIGGSDNPSAEGKMGSVEFQPAKVLEMIVSPASAHAETPAAYKKYPIKSGVITFERSGVIGSSRIIVYFDDYGAKERNEVYDDQGTLEEARFSDGETMYKLLPKTGDAKVAYAMGPGTYGTEMKFESDPYRTEKRKERHQFTRLPDMEILGKTCQAYSVKSKSAETVFAGWNNLLFYTKVTMTMGDTITRAVDFKENAEIDPSLFKVPADYTVQKP